MSFVGLKDMTLQNIVVVLVSLISSVSECPDVKNDSLTQSGTGCFTAVPIMVTVGVKGLTAGHGQAR